MSYICIKRILDILLTSFLIVFLSPLLIILMTIIKITEPQAPIFFKQERVGKEGKIFLIYKLRSMVKNADSLLQSDEKLLKEYIENSYKVEANKDPRITTIGRFLRKTSLDELPQLFNVLKGDMSLVGPRPVVIEELIEYKSKKEKFLSVKPGITGYWQVCGRSNVGYPERVELELTYVERKSLLFDTWILLRTIPSIIKKDGAY